MTYFCRSCRGSKQEDRPQIFSHVVCCLTPSYLLLCLCNHLKIVNQSCITHKTMRSHNWHSLVVSQYSAKIWDPLARPHISGWDLLARPHISGWDPLARPHISGWDLLAWPHISGWDLLARPHISGCHGMRSSYSHESLTYEIKTQVFPAASRCH